MSDIRLRLIRHAHINDQPQKARQVMLWAADEIEWLLAEVERLRGLCEKGVVALAMIERMAGGAIYSQESIHATAVAALKEISEDGCKAQTG